MRYSPFILGVCLIIFSKSMGFPTGIDRCKTGDTVCIKDITNIIMKTMYKGLPEMNLIAIDPILAHSIDMKHGGDSPFSFHMHFTDVNLSGVKNCVAYEISGFGKNLTGEHGMSFKCPWMTLIGPYSLTGRVLVLSLSGSGIANITMDDPHGTFSFTGKSIEKNGKIYMEPQNSKLRLNITRLHWYFENLYSGNELLTNGTNQFFNENWQVAWEEVKYTLYETFGKVTEAVIANVFRKIPYRELFSDFDGK